jgi:hypothetical protein
MTTTAAAVTSIRHLLKDNPVKLKLGAAQSDTTDETTTLIAGDISKVQTGMTLEHDDGSGEQRRVLSKDETAVTLEAERGFNGTTAATHLNSTYLLINPRFPYEEVSLCITRALDLFYDEGVYDIIEREVTSSASTDVYNAPASTLREILSVAMKPSTVTEPRYLTDFDPYPRNVDTDLYASGLSIRISEVYGTAGTDIFYLNCKEKLTISTITAEQERILHDLVCADLIETEVFKRLAGPTNQGDRTIRSSEFLQAAAVRRERALRALRVQASNLRSLYPRKRNWMHS